MSHRDARGSLRGSHSSVQGRGMFWLIDQHVERRVERSLRALLNWRSAACFQCSRIMNLTLLGAFAAPELRIRGLGQLCWIIWGSDDGRSTLCATTVHHFCNYGSPGTCTRSKLLPLAKSAPHQLQTRWESGHRLRSAWSSAPF